MAVQGKGAWDVTAAAPERLTGDFGALELEPVQGEACHLHPLPMRLRASPHVRCYGRELRTLMRQPWDIVHIWEEPYVVAGGQIARAAPAGACVVPATFQNIRKRYPLPFRQIERAVMIRANGWIAFGETVRETMCTKSEYRSKPAQVITPGVDLAVFRPDPDLRAEVRARLGWNDDSLLVGFLGRFVREKGLDVLLRALSRSRAPWRALFVGGGPLEAELHRFARRYPKRVCVRTGVSHDGVPAYLNAMDVLCAPSQTTSRWREQFGRMLIEAMACGVPVIASRSGEIPFVVGEAGMLIDEADECEWAAAVDRCLSNVEFRIDRSRRGLARVRERFAWPIVARAHLAFFDSLLMKRCAA
jgi:glycosyltransferase involved in cell wall biosynthesis